MTYQEELHFTQQLLIHMALGNVYELDKNRGVAIEFNDEYTGLYLTDDHLRIYRKLKETQHEVSLN